VNFGVVGQGTSSILDDLHTQVIGQGFDEVIIEGGMNDIGRPDAVEYITNNLRRMVQNAKAAGLKVVLVTITPYHRAKSQITQINSIILRDGRSWGADAVVDTHSVLRTLGHDLRSSYDAGDQLHLNVAGQQAMGQAILERAYK
jgi:lysophospholipase L1-like esterase